MKRETGFYWVTKEEIATIDISDRWFAGLYDSEENDWMLPGIAVLFKDKDLSRINEERILPPNQ